MARPGRRAIPLATLLALAALLAGCSDGNPASGDGEAGDGAGSGADGPDDPATHIAAPTWQVGHWWTLSSEQSGGTFTHVVSGDAGDDWVVDTDSADIAFFDARSDISFLGPVRKADLAGSQGSDRVLFFQFPLMAGKSWTTTWDGADITINVTRVADGRADLDARHANGTRYASYTYDAALGYFREYAFYAPDGETVGFGASVTSSGQGFAGELVRWTLAPLHEAHGPMAPRGTVFVVDPAHTDVWIDVAIACTGPGAFSVTFGPPTGPAEQRGFTASGPCPAAVAEVSTVPPPAQAEQWGVFVAGNEGTLDLTILGRTLTTFQAGAAP